MAHPTDRQVDEGDRASGEHGGVDLAGLTSAQREAVTATDPILCVLAGAGAGKTRVLTLRVARRVHDGSASAPHVLVCTFSRKAAEELRRRLWTLYVGGEVYAGTFHRTALHLIRRHHADRDLAPPVLTGDRRLLLASVAGSERVTRPGVSGRGAAGRNPTTRSAVIAQLEAEIGWAKARLVAPVDYETAAREAHRRPSMGVSRVADLYGRYEEAKRRQRVLDLDDLLWRAADLMETDAAFAAAVRWRFRHVFVDEMQDVNPAQFRLLEALLGDQPDLFVVGDPHQSVYGWNGADPGLLERLPDTFLGTRVLHLGENHRSSPQVVTVAAAALGLSGESAPTSSRPPGTVPKVTSHRTDREEAASVAREVWKAHRPGRRWSHLAVLARTNAQLLRLVESMDAQRIPCRLAGGDLGPASDLAPEEPAAKDDDEKDDVEGGDEGGRPTPQRDPGDAVVLTTFHRSKGLQWPAVWVVGLSEGLVPIGSARTKAARAEERRLLYVALTRAEEELACSWAEHRDEAAASAGGLPRLPSPWLDDVTRATASLAEAARPPDGRDVAARLAEIRSLLEGAPRPRD